MFNASFMSHSQIDCRLNSPKIPLSSPFNPLESSPERQTTANLGDGLNWKKHLTIELMDDSTSNNMRKKDAADPASKDDSRDP